MKLSNSGVDGSGDDMAQYILGSHQFTTVDQDMFAALSGDYNPMHMDPIAARRTSAGAPVVHGVHTLLWSLDSLAKAYPDLPQIAAVKVRFDKLIYVDETAQVILKQLDTANLLIEVVVDHTVVCRIAATFGTPHTKPADIAVGSQLYHPNEGILPLDLTLKEMSGRAGKITFPLLPAQIADIFPDAARNWGSQRISALTCCSYLVGMICPGLNSIFGGLTLTFCEDDPLENDLAFRVTKTDVRFRSVRLEISGGGLAGIIDSFGRRPPAAQPTMAALTRLVAADEFADSTALVVGGSRGLGELTAKLLAAGGAQVISTYSVGLGDALRLQQEIAAAGGACDILKYDVRSPAQTQLDALVKQPCMVFYFATPSIFRRKADVFVEDRFSEFLAFYVNGFYNLSEELRRRRPAGVSIFYPSSIAVDERPPDMTEYAMSKMAGEILCADMQVYQQPIAITVNRLPRLPTDQTAALTEMASADPCIVMLPIVREVHRRRFTKG
jgi:NAD(P)-dependent dehydrogenase (short-subunit alcohol dehydrogenase family)